MAKNILIKLSNYLRISEKFLIQFIIKFNINLLPLKKQKNGLRTKRNARLVVQEQQKDNRTST